MPQYSAYRIAYRQPARTKGTCSSCSVSSGVRSSPQGRGTTKLKSTAVKQPTMPGRYVAKPQVLLSIFSNPNVGKSRCAVHFANAGFCWLFQQAFQKQTSTHKIKMHKSAFFPVIKMLKLIHRERLRERDPSRGDSSSFWNMRRNSWCTRKRLCKTPLLRWRSEHSCSMPKAC